jgi:V8-like Glu-specific endopeptidase
MVQHIIRRATPQTMLILWLALLASPSHAAIFGVDDRIAISPATPAYDLARSTAIAVLSGNQTETSPGKLALDTGSTQDLVCAEERFSKEPYLSWACSGFLVAPDLIATAGHCMVNTGESRHETETYCEAFSWLFDYHQDKNGKVQISDIPADKLYGCKQVVYAIKEEKAPYRDFALVQLDRPVTGRTPLKISSSPASEGDPLTMIGYPFGTPAKLSRNAKVLLNDRARESFITNLDAFEGNSGSAVFNSANEVVGILIGGTPSLSFVDTKNSCQRYNHCLSDGTGCSLPDKDTSFFPGFQRVGSEVQRIAPILELMKTLAP